MKSFTEKIKAIWNSREKILEAVKNRTFTDEHIESVVKERQEICASNKCGYYETAGSGCIEPGQKICCRECGCSLPLKLYSMSSGCGLGHWDPIMDEDIEDELNNQTK